MSDALNSCAVIAQRGKKQVTKIYDAGLGWQHLSSRFLQILTKQIKNSPPFYLRCLLRFDVSNCLQCVLQSLTTLRNPAHFQRNSAMHSEKAKKSRRLEAITTKNINSNAFPVNKFYALLPETDSIRQQSMKLTNFLRTEYFILLSNLEGACYL